MASAELKLEPIFDALKQPLALVESDERRRSVETYLDAARHPVERAVYDVVSQMVEAVDAAVGPHYRVRLGYRPDGLTVEVDEQASAEGEEPQFSSVAEGDVEKITIRIPAELKDMAQQAASRAGTSANTWFVKALARAVRNIDIQTSPAPPVVRVRPGRRDEAEADDQSWTDERGHKRGARLSGWVGGDED